MGIVPNLREEEQILNEINIRININLETADESQTVACKM